MLWLIRPRCFSDHEMIENCESKIHQNASADSTVGTMKGISTDRAQHRLERHVLVQQQREIEADGEFDGAGDERVEQRVEDREPEDRVVPQPLVVLGADELPDAADLGVGEGEPDAEPERIGQEEDQERHRRQHEPEAEPVPVVLELVPRGRFADLRLGAFVGASAMSAMGQCPGDAARVRWNGRRSAAARPDVLSDRCASTAARLPPSRSWRPWRRCSSWRTCRPR